MNRTLLTLQLVGTLVILGLVPGNLATLAFLLVLWALTFGPATRPEAVLFAIACVFFTVMNALSLQQGIFAFTNPDILGMPWYELVMWGFYLLHTRRMVGGPAPPMPGAVVWGLALAYSVAFGTIADGNILLAVTGVLLAVGLALYHEPRDLAYVGYMILLGAAIEYTGTLSGEWHYPGEPLGGVPLWFITLWGGVGLFLRRLVLPYVEHFERRRMPPAAA